jgi:hypothetical protein
MEMKMRGFVAAPLIILALAACSSGGGVAEGSNPGVAARFAPGGAADILQVTVNDRQPVRSVELIGPGETTVPAYAINSEPPRYRGAGGGFFPSIGIGIGGGGGGVGGGLGIGLPIGGFGSAGSDPASATMVSNGYIKLPDRGVYLRDWQNYRIRVEIGWPPDSRIVEAPAPPPK